MAMKENKIVFALALLFSGLLAWKGLPILIRVVEYITVGGDRIYAIIPVVMALVFAVAVLFMFLLNQDFLLFLLFIVAFPLISVLRRRIEFEYAGAQFFVETFLLLAFATFIMIKWRPFCKNANVIYSLVLISLLFGFSSAFINNGLNIKVFGFILTENFFPFLIMPIAFRLVRDKEMLFQTVNALLLTVVVFTLLSFVWVYVLDITENVDASVMLTAQTRIGSGFRRLLVGAGLVTGNVANRLFIMVLPVAIATVSSKWKIKKNIIPYFVILACIYFVFASEFRAGMLGIAGIIVFFVTTKKSLNVGLTVKLLVASVIVVFFSDFIVEYLNRRIVVDGSLLLDSSARKRLVLWQFAGQLFLDNPLLGIGPLGYLNRAMGTAGQALTAHNYYLNLLAEQGLLGFLSHMILCGYILIKGVAKHKLLIDERLRNLSFGILIGIFIYYSLMIFAGGRLTHNNVIYIHTMYWLMVSLLWLIPRFDEVRGRTSEYN
jgi:O-antigen ligase